MIFEVCIDSYEGALLAQEYKAKRVELCSALSVGGLTPSPYLTKMCSGLSNLETHVMIRPREGNFCYNEKEIRVMIEEIRLQAAHGARGVVFGCLTPNNSIDIQNNIVLVEEARSRQLECTFHRAFDFVENANESLESIINIGFNRLLSSGGRPTAIEGLQELKQLVQYANGAIEIMAGSGINESNALQLASIQVDALHFTSHSSTSYQLGMGVKTNPDFNKIKSITQLFT